MPDSASAEETVIRIAALKAAKDAAEHMAQAAPERKTSSVGAFALYTWGSLAFVSAIFAVFVGFNPNTFTLEPQRIADAVLQKPASKTELPAQPQVAQAEPKSLPIASPTTLPEVLPVTPPEQSLAIVAASDDDLMTSDMPLEATETKPSLKRPQVTIPEVHAQALENEGALDLISTGSVNAYPEDEELQPFPDDVIAPSDLLAVNIGQSKAVAPLIQRYAALKRRAPDLFMDLEPRIQLAGENAKLHAQLIAGPFTSPMEVARFCRELRLRLTVDCSVSSFEGDTIQ